MKTTSLVCAAIVALLGTSLAGGEGWSSDYEAAKKQALESKKDLLMDFTGSDWCGWCIKLNDEVFKHDAFKSGVKDAFVLVEIDFPQDKSKLTEETRKQNKELGEKYAVQGYPTILLCDAAGRPYAATGYQKGGPEKYVAHLNELRKHKAARDEAFSKAEKAVGIEKAKELIAALDSLTLEDAMIANFYGEIAAQIKAADPEDKTGFAAKSASKKRLTDFQNKLQELAQAGDMDGALALADATLKEAGFDKETTFNLMMTRVMILAEQKKFDDAIKAIDETKAAHPDSPMMTQLDAFRKKLEDDKKNAAGDKNAPEGME